MCLAVFKPPGVSIDTAKLHKGWISNSDGAGFAFVKDGKVVVSKEHMTWKELLEAYTNAHKANPNSPFLIHFRIRSMGARNSENTHPYQYEHGAMIHNGSLTGTAAVYDKGKSDTALFIEKYGKEFTFEFLNEHKDEMGKAVGWNKLAFLFDDGKHVIINEGQGVWDNGSWFSNHSFKIPESWRNNIQGQHSYD